MTVPGLTFQAASREKWRSWLKRNHARKDEIWLVYYKKTSGKPSISYMESVEEALCFGWIDGIKKRIDDERYAHRFTPRRPGSRWSETNLKLAEELIAQGRMADAGLQAYSQREEYSEETVALIREKAPELPVELEKALKKNAKAWRNFKALPPGYRKHYILWLTTAKRQETRDKRLREALRLLENNEKLGMT